MRRNLAFLAVTLVLLAGVPYAAAQQHTFAQKVVCESNVTIRAATDITGNLVVTGSLHTTGSSYVGGVSTNVGLANFQNNLIISGDVGINTPPSYDLHVDGTIYGTTLTGATVNAGSIVGNTITGNTVYASHFGGDAPADYVTIANTQNITGLKLFSDGLIVTNDIAAILSIKTDEPAGMSFDLFTQVGDEKLEIKPSSWTTSSNLVEIGPNGIVMKPTGNEPQVKIQPPTSGKHATFEIQSEVSENLDARIDLIGRTPGGNNPGVRLLAEGQASGVQGGQFVVQVDNASGTLTERLRINSSGLADITGPLHVAGVQTNSSDVICAQDLTVATNLYIGTTATSMGYFGFVSHTQLVFVATYTNGAALSPTVTNVLDADISTP